MNPNPRPCDPANAAEAGRSGRSAARRIDFVVVGAQKAGTTALFEHLADDPTVGLSDVKEVHFFDDEAQDWNAPDYEAYHAHFDWSRAPVQGEATPIYLYWPNSLERIRAYNPGIRLIVMLRDPVERAWSHWRMEHGRGVEPNPFGWCIREGRQRLFDADPWGHHREFSYVERGFYGAQLEHLFGLFPREQVLVLQAHKLQADPQATLARVNVFLGLGAPPPARSRAVHVGPDMGAPSAQDVAFLRDVFARDDQRLEALTGVSYAPGRA